MNRWLRVLSLGLCLLLLASCAAQKAYREGNRLFEQGQGEEGIARLEEAVRLKPDSVQYRIALANRRNDWVTALLQDADTALRAGRVEDAGKAFRRVQVVDPENSQAAQGLLLLAQQQRHKQAVAEAETAFRQGDTAGMRAAREKVRSVLIENPRQKEALNLKARMDDAQAREPKPEARLAEAYRKPISLEFRETPIKQVFDAISRVSGLNFFFDKDVRPDIKASILARSTTVEDAVRMLLVTNQLEQKVLNESTVLIFPNTPQKLKDYQTLAVRTFYVANAEVKTVASTLSTILKAKNMVVDERLGLIIIRDTPEVIRVAERLIALQDLADPEVMLDVQILEIKRAKLLELGVRWPDQASFGPLAATSSSSLTLAQLLDLDRNTIAASVGDATINLKKDNQRGDILANPRIRVQNKEKAKILIGDRVPVITTTSTSTGFVSDSVNYVDVGLKLEVEPNIRIDDNVLMKVNLEVSSLVREVTSKSGTLAYQIGTRNATTALQLRDGETQVLAGLISDEDRKSSSRVPGLGDLPVLGRLFGSQKDDKQRSEIVLTITPHIVRGLQRPDLVDAEFESGTDAVVGAPPLLLAPTQSGEVEPAASSVVPGAPVSPASTGVVNDTQAVPAQDPPNVPAALPSAATTVVPSAVAPSVVTPVVAPAATPSAPVAVAVATVSDAPAKFRWLVPAQVRAGEQFTAVLELSSDEAIASLPLMIGFDPRVLQVTAVLEGDFLAQGGNGTHFNQRVDAAKGRVFVATVRDGGSGASGSGRVAMLTVKALAASSGTTLQLLSATPEPAVRVNAPLEQRIKVAP